MKFLKQLKYIIVFIPFFLNAQNYTSLLNDNRVWDDWTGIANFPMDCEFGKRVLIDGDTIISNVSYKKLWTQSIYAGGEYPMCDPFVIDTILYPINDKYLREDTILKKVFVITNINNFEEEYLIYDFSLSVGDTLKSSYTGAGDVLVVNKIDTIQLLNGELRRRFDFDYGSYYIEGIGGGLGLLNPITVLPDFNIMLICVKDNNIPIWGDRCDYNYVGLENTIFEQKIKLNIYPQPAQNSITVEVDANKYYNFKIYDLLGNFIVEKSFHGSKNNLNISDLSNGVYLGIILYDGIIVEAKKFVVQN